MVSCLKCVLNVALAYKIQNKIIESQTKLAEGWTTNTVFIIKDTVEVENEKCEQIVEEIDKFTGSNVTSAHSVVTHPVMTKCEEIFPKDTCDLDLNKISNKVASEKNNEVITKLKTKVPLADRRMKSINIPSKIKDIQLVFTKRIGRVDPNSPYTCSYCTKQFPTKRKYGAHILCHKRKRCPICDKLVSYNNYTHHVKNHDRSPRICELCGSQYLGSEALRAHMVYKHKDVKYECQICQTVFRTRQARDKHKLKEHGNEPSRVNAKLHIFSTTGDSFLKELGE